MLEKTSAFISCASRLNDHGNDMVVQEETQTRQVDLK
jgi:hypothetical protein